MHNCTHICLPLFNVPWVSSVPTIELSIKHIFLHCRSFYVGDAAGRPEDHSDADIRFAEVSFMAYSIFVSNDFKLDFDPFGLGFNTHWCEMYMLAHSLSIISFALFN